MERKDKKMTEMNRETDLNDAPIKFWKTKNIAIASIGTFLVILVIVLIPSLLLFSKDYKKDLINENEETPVDFFDLHMDDIEQLKCSSSNQSILGEVSNNIFFRTKLCPTDNEGVGGSTDQTITRGSWYTFVGDGSCLHLSTCVARIRIFTDDMNECYKADKDFGMEDDCSFVRIETEYGKTYRFYVDFPNSSPEVDLENYDFKFDILCNNCEPIIKSPSPTYAPTITSYPTLSIHPTHIPSTTMIPTNVPTPGPCFPSICNWQDISDPFTGERAEDFLGGSIDNNLSNSVVAINKAGNIVAFGAELADDDTFEDNGSVKVFQLNNEKTEWIQLGQTLKGDHSNHNFGTSIALSSDGFTIVIGAPNYGVDNNGDPTKTGHARVFQYDQLSTEMWIQKGSDLDNDNPATMTGFDVAINSMGSIVALGSRAASLKTGRAIVFQWDEANNLWTQMGDAIFGDQTDSSDGRSIALSADGLILAIGGPHYDTETEKDNGRVRVFQYTSGSWTLMSDPIIGDEDSLFGFSVDLSSDGMVVAVGARWDSDGGQSRSGSASVYMYDDIENTWGIMAAPLRGSRLDQLGVSVCLSADGREIAVGALGSKASPRLPWVAGNYVRVYQYFVEDGGFSIWLDKGNPISGETASRSAESIALSGDGSTLAVGAALADDENNIETGNVRVLKFKRDESIPDPIPNFEPRYAPASPPV